MVNHTSQVPTCPQCNKTFLARKKWSRKQLLKDIDKNLSDQSLTMLHRAVYLAEQPKRLIIHSSTDWRGKIGLDSYPLPPNTEYVLFTLFKGKNEH